MVDIGRLNGIGGTQLKNKKLFLLNIIIGLLFIVVVGYGLKTWGSQGSSVNAKSENQTEVKHAKVENEAETEAVDEVKFLQNFPKLASYLVGKDAIDLELFASFEEAEEDEDLDEEEEIEEVEEWETEEASEEWTPSYNQGQSSGGGSGSGMGSGQENNNGPSSDDDPIPEKPEKPNKKPEKPDEKPEKPEKPDEKPENPDENPEKPGESEDGSNSNSNNDSGSNNDENE